MRQRGNTKKIRNRMKHIWREWNWEWWNETDWDGIKQIELEWNKKVWYITEREYNKKRDGMKHKGREWGRESDGMRQRYDVSRIWQPPLQGIWIIKRIAGEEEEWTPWSSRRPEEWVPLSRTCTARKNTRRASKTVSKFFLLRKYEIISRNILEEALQPIYARLVI